MGVDDFWHAVDRFPLIEMPLAMPADVERRLQECLMAGGPLLLGELHGAAENPVVVHALMRRLGLRVLALEWDPNFAPALQQYLLGEVVDTWPAQFSSSSDGRITAGHLAVLRVLHGAGVLERVVLFDAPALGGWSGRDQLMAERLLAGIAGASPALVVAGRLHTRRRRHRHGVPMGQHVARARSGTTEVLIEYLGGEIFNLGRMRVGGGRLLRRHLPASDPQMRIEGDRVVLTLPMAHPAIVPSPRGRLPGC